jgi:GxxExxY protein
MELNELTEKILSAAYEVHSTLGPGLLESAYESCLRHELQEKGFFVEHQKPVPLFYKNVRLDCGYRLDLLVENTVIIELKTVDHLQDIHTAQMITYLKLSKKSTGLLLNFNTKSLKNGIKRVVYTHKTNT